MRHTHFLPTRRVSPEQVLEIFRDFQRRMGAIDPGVDERFEPTFEAPVKAWRAAADLVRGVRLGRELNAWFGINVSDGEWRQVLEPTGTRTLRGECELIASRAEMPVLKPYPAGEGGSWTVGAFLVVRLLLAAQGVTVSGIRPSSPLTDVSWPHFGRFMTDVSMLAPGVLPPLEIRDRLHRALLFTWLAALVAGGCGSHLELTVLAGVAWPAALMLFAGMVVVSRRAPSSVTLGSLTTFRDLTELLAAHARRGSTSAQHTPQPE